MSLTKYIQSEVSALCAPRFDPELLAPVSCRNVQFVSYYSNSPAFLVSMNEQDVMFIKESTSKQQRCRSLDAVLLLLAIDYRPFASGTPA
jgi:hypothetical protein